MLQEEDREREREKEGGGRRGWIDITDPSHNTISVKTKNWTYMKSSPHHSAHALKLVKIFKSLLDLNFSNCLTRALQEPDVT